MERYLLNEGEVYLEALAIEGPFDRALAALRQQGLELATAEEFARIDMLSRSRSSAWLAEGGVYLPSGEVLLTDNANNPLLQFPKEATDAHRAGNEFYIEDSLAKELLRKASQNPEEARKRGVLKLPKRCEETIDYVNFPEEPLTRFLYPKVVGEYAKFYLDQTPSGNLSISFTLVSKTLRKKQEKPFCRPLVYVPDTCLFYLDLGMDQSFLEPGMASLINKSCRTYGLRQVGVVPFSIFQALNEGKSFEYEGKTYTPLELKKE